VEYGGLPTPPQEQAAETKGTPLAAACWLIWRGKGIMAQKAAGGQGSGVTKKGGTEAGSGGRGGGGKGGSGSGNSKKTGKGG
jgi:hypothetical protein